MSLGFKRLTQLHLFTDAAQMLRICNVKWYEN